MEPIQFYKAGSLPPDATPAPTTPKPHYKPPAQETPSKARKLPPHLLGACEVPTAETPATPKQQISPTTPDDYKQWGWTNSDVPEWLQIFVGHVPMDLIQGLAEPDNVTSTPQEYGIPDHPYILLLYAGKDDNTSTASTIHDTYPWLTKWIIEHDIVRDTRHDILQPDLYYHLLQSARKGHLMAIIGGPNCRTWSICLHRPDKTGHDGEPVRARHYPYCWGMKDLTKQQDDKVDADSLLLLKQLTLYHVSQAHNPDTAFLIEHPADPAAHSSEPTAHLCSSIWATSLLPHFQGHHSMETSTWPQCASGMDTQKWTTVMYYKMPHMRRLNNLRCTHKTHKSNAVESSDLARWSPGLRRLVASSLAQQYQHLKQHKPTEPAPDTPRDKIRQNIHPVQVTIGHKQRPIRDGAGKTSSHRLPLGHRPRQPLLNIGKALAAYAGTANSLRSSTDQLLSGACTTNPYPHHTTLHAQSILCTALDFYDTTVPCGQPFALPLMTALALAANDPDHGYPYYVSEGVPLGVEESLPLSPGIWPTYEELRANQDTPHDHHDDEDIPPPTSCPNYPSATAHTNAIRETYKEEVPLGMTLGPLTLAEAATICMCEPHQICAGALAGKPEGRYLDKLRTIHDATVNNVNTWIRHNQREKTTAPTLHDAMTALYHCPRDTILLKLDITKAHRRIKLLLKDWKYVAATLDDEVWLNTVGTYGVASAQYYWGRMAALILRLTHATIPDLLWGFVYVDDFLFLIQECHATTATTTILLLFNAMGIPISWKKSTIGHINHWLGYHLNSYSLTCRITPEKHVIITQILENYQSNTPKGHKELESELGKLNWALMICPPLRPMLTPMYAWLKSLQKASPNATGRPSKEISYLAQTMLHTLNNKPAVIVHDEQPLLILAATDAGANDRTATIGGWYSNLKNPQKDQVHWFFMAITPESHQWAYEKLTPQQSISAIELYGTMMLTKYLSDTNSEVCAQLPIRTDNQGNAYNVANYKAKKWPNYAILLEMALHEYHTGIHPVVSHTHRENNQWADQLTHSDTTGFNPDLEITIDESTINWHIFRQLTDKHRK